MRNIFLVLGILFYFSSCQSAKKETTDSENPPALAEEEALLSQGFQLLEANCFSCHSPNAGHEDRIAPPMEAVKRHYITENTTQEEFVEALTRFVENPSEDLSRMPGAIRRFGLMPKMNFSQEQLQAIAHYIYQTELEAPDWFEKHYQAERKRHRKHGEEDLSYKERGQQLAMATKSVLGKNLLYAIQHKGTAGALEFCNTKAYPLTDSMAMVLEAHIRRVSDQPRNPENAADEDQQTYIREAKAQIAATGKAEPRVLELNGKMVGYYPIMTNQRCMQCHGKELEEVKAETLQEIKRLYPDDQATGYGLNELRGIWVVEMDKE